LFSLFPHPITTSFVLLITFILLTGFLVYLTCPILGLLLLLVYFGALIILFCYLVMYIPVFLAPSFMSPFSLFLLILVSTPSLFLSHSIYPFLYSPSLILGLGALLLLALVLVVFLVDLGRGRFTA